MARQEIILGTPPTGLGGDPPRVASMKINAMTLELYGAAGIGGIAAKLDRASVLIDDPNNVSKGLGGFNYVNSGAANTPTELTAGWGIFTIPGTTSGTACSQIAFPLTGVAANKNRVWSRQCFNNVWSAWTESITATSMAALFGIGGTSANVTDLDVLFGTNVYRVLGSATGTPVNQAGMVQHMQYGATTGSASAQIYTTFESNPRMFYRSRPTNGVYTSWITSATTDNVEARLAFYGISLAAADQSQAATNLNAAITPNRYRVAANAINKPGTLGGILEVIKGFANDVKQEFTESGTSTLWVRSTNNGGTSWTAWDKKASQVDVDAKASSGSNGDITALTGMTTALSIAQGGNGTKTGISTQAQTALDTKFDAAKAILDPQFSGGLLSYGSNSTGEWWKFLSGLMITSQRFTGVAASWFSPGGGIRYRNYQGSLPVAFPTGKAPRIICTPLDPDISACSAWVTNASSTITTFEVYFGALASTTGAGPLTFEIFAIGSWK